MADELFTDERGRTYKVIRHFRRRPQATGQFKTVYQADSTGRKHRVRVPDTKNELVLVGVQHIRVGETRKIGRRKRQRQLQADSLQHNAEAAA